MLETFTAETFAPHVGTTFRLYPDESHGLDVELVTVTNPGAQTAASEQPRRIPFSLVFRGPGNFVLPQRIYRIEHAAIGTFDLFLVPIGPDQAGMRYEAIFT